MSLYLFLLFFMSLILYLEEFKYLGFFLELESLCQHYPSSCQYYLSSSISLAIWLCSSTLPSFYVSAVSQQWHIPILSRRLYHTCNDIHQSWLNDYITFFQWGWGQWRQSLDTHRAQTDDDKLRRFSTTEKVENDNNHDHNSSSMEIVVSVESSTSDLNYETAASKYLRGVSKKNMKKDGKCGHWGEHSPERGTVRTGTGMRDTGMTRTGTARKGTRGLPRTTTRKTDTRGEGGRRYNVIIDCI